MADQKKIKIANHAYSGRYGNGAESTGDGWKYRGKGFFHLTWKDNYLAFQKHLRRSFPKEYGEIDLVSNPDLVSSDIRIGLLSALWYFKTRVVDRMHGGVHAASVERVTLALNPNASTLSDRIATYKRLMLSMPRRIDMPTKSFATDVAFV